MISVWPKFYTATENFRAMKEKGFLYPETLKRPTKDWLGHVHTFYDAFNPEARKLFWKQMNERALQQGRGRLVDGRDRAGAGGRRHGRARSRPP